jgi:VanZ family protein
MSIKFAIKLLKWLDSHPFIYWVPVCFALLIIFYYSLTPMPSRKIIDMVSSNFDMLHIPAYFALSLLAGIAFRHSKFKLFNKNSYVLAVFFSACLGGFIELAQGFIPGRNLSFMDMMFNLAGIFSAQLIRFVLKIEKRLLDKLF